MSPVAELRANYAASRARLWSPPNAVPDRGLHMKNGWPVEAPEKPVQASLTVVATDQGAPQDTHPGPLRRRRHRGPRPNPKAVPHACKWTTRLGCEPRILIPEHYITSRHVIAAVAKVWDIQPAILTGPRRELFAIIPRHVALALCRHLTPLSRAEIGRSFGDRDHTSVMHADRKMQPHIDAVAMMFDSKSLPEQWARAMKARLET